MFSLLNNFLVAHIEGGEVSGTIDEMLRHSISKISHLHLVSNKIARKRLIQMGENKKFNTTKPMLRPKATKRKIIIDK